MRGMATTTNADQTPNDAQQMLEGLTWPAAAPHGGGQISLANLLIALQFLGTDADRETAARSGQRWDQDTPGSLQVLKSGVTGVTKWWTKRAGVVGGAVGVLAAVGGVVIGAIKPFREALGESVIVALVGGGALILSATVLALAHFVNGDLMARAQATAARSAGRAEVVATFLRTAAAPPIRDAPAAEAGLRQELVAALSAFDHVHVRVKHSPDWTEATAIQRCAEGFQVRVTGGDWKPLAQIEQYTTDPS